MLESGADAGDDPAAAEVRGDRRPAGGAVRRPRALVGIGIGAVRCGAAALRRLPRRRRRARRRAGGRPGVRLAPGRGDRGLPHRPGRARERAQARRRAERGLDRPAQTVAGSSRVTTTAGLRDGRVRRRTGAEEHAYSALPRSRARCLFAPRRGKAPRSRSCCGRSERSAPSDGHRSAKPQVSAGSAAGAASATSSCSRRDGIRRRAGPPAGPQAAPHVAQWKVPIPRGVVAGRALADHRPPASFAVLPVANRVAAMRALALPHASRWKAAGEIALEPPERAQESARCRRGRGGGDRAPSRRRSP